MAVQDYYDLFQKAAKEYGLDPAMLMAQADVESGGDPTRPGPKTKYGQPMGLMQILDVEAKSAGIDPLDPAQAIDFAAKRMADNMKATGGDSETALKLYYGGPNQKIWGSKTAAYPGLVKAKYPAYAKLATDNSRASLLDALNGDAPAAIPPAKMNHDDLIAALEGRQPGQKEAPAAPAPTAGETVSDVLRSGGTGLVKGVGDVLGLPGDLRELAAGGIGHVAEALAPGTGSTASNVVNSALSTLPLGMGSSPGSGPINSLLGNAVGGFHQPTTTPGKYAETIGEFAPATLMGGGGGIGRAFVRNALLPAIGSEFAGQQTEGTSAEPYARFAGAIGPGLASSGARSLLGMGSISPERAALAQKAINSGIDLRPSQISDQPFIKMLDSAIGKLPFSGLGPHNEKQMESFGRAVASTFGSDATNLTPKVMNDAKERIGEVFNRVGAKTNIVADNTFHDRLFGVLKDAENVVPEHDAKVIQNQIENIISTVDKNGTLSGKSYQALIAHGGAIDRGMHSSNSEIRYYVGKLRDVLDDGLQSAANPQDLADLKKARLEYKNLMTVKDIAAKANIEGEISPALLLGAVKKSYNNMAFTGAGQIGDLAKIGQGFLKESPSSTTAERTLLYKLTHGLGAGATGAVGAFGLMHPEELLHTGAAMGGILAGGRIIGTALKNKTYRNALLRSALNPPQSGLSSNAPATLLGVHTLAGHAGWRSNGTKVEWYDPNQ